ncbi:hypothetical protein LTR08_006070 [Meristemomyces frigidus]|nr:hypothetical protein LTR08_006070 [Meristemomyces frigidus]
MAPAVESPRPRASRKRALYESRREREFYRYFDPIKKLTKSGPPLCDLQDEDSVKKHQPCSSPDRALTAFCQLGALRLGTRRAMLFFFDASYAYVLAEATRTLSLHDDSVDSIDDQLWLGHSIIPRGFSICEDTVCRLPDPDSPDAGDPEHSLIHIINDLEADTTFCNRPFVTDGPKARFYAGVPITTPKGINIGAYCLLDDRKRESGLDAKGVAFLKDMASTIMVHLEMVRAKSEHERGTQMITGLGAFIEGASSLREWQEESHRRERKTGGDAVSSRQGRPPLGHPRSTSSGSAGGDTKAQSPRRKEQGAAIKLEAAHESTESVTTLRDLSDHGVTSTPAEPVDSTPSKPAKTVQNGEDLRAQLVATNVKTAFQRAASLVREAVDVDGTLFLDATVGTYGGLVEHTTGSDRSAENHLSANATGTESEGRKSSKSDDQAAKVCKVLASSHTSHDYYHSDSEMQRMTDKYPITEKFLRSLLKKYPRGKIWSFNEDGDASSDDESSSVDSGATSRSRSHTSQTSQANPTDAYGGRKNKTGRRRIDDGREIQRLFPGVRSLALVGMWDQSRARWFSACAVWTYSPLRLFSQESEVAYLSAFNDVVVAEVHRLEALNSDTAKSDFISSISHELRSPLHGILGSVECLQEQQVDSFSEGLISQIDICGRTLLDIVDHLLDFSKINYHAKSKVLVKDGLKSRGRMSGSAERMSQLGGMMSDDADVALDEITEEVVETAVYSFCCSREKQSILDRKVAVVFDIDQAVDSNWRCRVPQGGWKRICLNLVSNSLKYTNAGYIRVGLKAESIPGKRKRFNAVFSVIDSGKGMSREFVENHLFKAFSQEDSLMEGTGLGMSLVAKIVKAMEGKIEVQSEKGVGTTTTVTIPMDHSSRAVTNDYRAVSRRPFQGSSIGILGFQDVGPQTTALDCHQNGRALVLSSVQRSCEYLGLQTRRADWELVPKADIYLIAEADLGVYQEQLRSRRSPTVIVLCDSAISARQLKAAARGDQDFECVSQPCGTDRLRKAIKYCLERAARIEGLTTVGTVSSVSPLVETLRFPATGTEPERLPHRTRKQPTGSTSDNAAMSGDDVALQATASPDRPDTTIRHSLPSEEKDDYLSSRSKSMGAVPLSPFPVDPVSPRKPVIRQSDTGVSSNGLSLLLVDDNQINLQLLVNYAKKQGHRKITASDGMQAVAAYKSACLSSQQDPLSSTLPSEKPQVVLMDINMPVLNGFEATRMIRAFEQQNSLQPAHIIALTGLGSASAQQEAYSSGVDLFLTKPVRLKELTKLLVEIRKSEAGKSEADESSATLT